MAVFDRDTSLRTRVLRPKYGGMSATRCVVILGFPGVQALDVVGPLEVFQGANQIVPEAYAVEFLASGSVPIGSSSGLELGPATAFGEYRGSVDTVLVAGGPGVEAASGNADLTTWVGAVAASARRVASVCNGALILAAAGVLDGRRATTHWAASEELAGRYPAVRVEPNLIFVRDGNVWTSAGVTAGIDLALALVEQDLGRDVALQIARWLVMFLQRPGGQSQFSAQLAAQRAERQPLRDLQAWIANNLAGDLRVEVLAERAAMSPRHFARAFRREVGVTPAAYVELARVEIACHALVDGSDIGRVVRRCGFGTSETMRRAFRRRLGVSPGAYRDRFRRVIDHVT